MKDQLKTIHGHEVFVLRMREVPLIWLHRKFGYPDTADRSKFTVVIVKLRGERVGLVVDSIISQQQVLIKGLQSMVRGTKGISGATILGDGNVALILDINSLFDR